MNNMGDGAFEETERQFLGLLEAAAGPELCVRCSLAYLPEIPRGAAVRGRLAERYVPVAALSSGEPDAYLITGAEPLTAELRDERYFASLAAVIALAGSGPASLWCSCLAAHAATSVLDGVERTRLSEKCIGVFAHEVAPVELLAGIDPPLWLPHSRYNDCSADALRAAGYDLLAVGNEAGAALASRDHSGCLIVLSQGHPEYGPTSLLREYRRDARRYLDGALEIYPAIPSGYLDDVGEALLDAFAVEARLARRAGSPAGVPQFPFAEVAGHVRKDWQAEAVQLTANWLKAVRDRVHARA